MGRKIIHIDMDAFYASVEQRDNPELRGKPVAVGGSPSGRGVVAAASYEARKFGIRSAMSARRAKEKCPHLIFVRSRFQVYREASQKFHRIIKEVTDLYEPLALDEAYLDVTENKLNEPSAYRIAMYLRARIRGQLNLTASAGVAPNKFIAKVASEMGKPNGLVVVPPEKVSTFVEKLPVKQLWGIGPKTAQKLQAQGILTTADIRKLGRDGALRRFGKSGSFIFDLAHGKDERKVCPFRKAKSRSAETTFPEDVLNLEDLRQTLERLAERICGSLETRQLRASGISLKLRYHNFETITRSCSLSPPSWESTLVAEKLKKLLEDTDAGKRPVRLIGAKVERFSPLTPSPQLVMDEILQGIE